MEGGGGVGEEVRERSACKQQELLQATRALGLGIRVTFPDMIERLVLMELFANHVGVEGKYIPFNLSSY